jgi:hypothetical protein
MHIFDRDTSLRETAPSFYTGAISENWLINRNPNGGYLMVILARAMMDKSVKKTTPIITANYISRCRPGGIEIRVEEISVSRQFSRYEARLFQDGAEKIRAFGTFADENSDCTISRNESSAPQLAERNACIGMPPIPGYTVFDNLDLLLDPPCAGWLQGNLVETSENRGWFRFREARQHDIFSVLQIIDSMPPAAFASQGVTAWVPTIELSVSIRVIPDTEWLRCSLRTRHITCGLLEADCEVWDETGTLAAISRQIAQFRSQ